MFANISKDFWTLQKNFKGENTENTRFLGVFAYSHPYKTMSNGWNMFFLKDIFNINLLKP